MLRVAVSILKKIVAGRGALSYVKYNNNYSRRRSGYHLAATLWGAGCSLDERPEVRRRRCHRAPLHATL